MPAPVLPARISRLEELAKNLWWSWHEEARDLFRALDYSIWRDSGHNPVKLLIEIGPDKLQAAASDPSFLALYDSVMALLDADLAARDTWFATRYPELAAEPIAYFSAEFAFHRSLPIYAGGLGVMSGDHLKEASDLGLPVVGLGFMYPQGYFEQHISPEGWQEEFYRQLNFEEAPITPCAGPVTCGPLVQIQVADRAVHIGAWSVSLGRNHLYLLDTNVEGNSPQDRQLSARLYTADREQRIQQEVVLGIGGVRVLRELGIRPGVWHANEGHTSFMILERIREEVEKGASFAEAAGHVTQTTIFTTHTPVPAGHDIFPVDLMERYFRRYSEALRVDWNTFLGLGRRENGDQTFNMAALALRLANYRNAVSQVHGTVARRMWHVLWPELKEDEVPISHITNGVHMPTWIAPELYDVFEKYLGHDFLKRHDEPQLWDRVFDIPDKEIWEIHQELKRKMIHSMLERAQHEWATDEGAADHVLAMGPLLDQDALTIAFARRFVEYKRPTLMFRDIERLKRLVKNRWRPIQFIFAGKSHPADFPSKHLLHHVYSLAKDRDFQGRIAFVEDYDVHLARFLVQGVDVWMNVPRRLQEACGTSGMKASMNGVPNLSVRDGWWYEGYNASNGWAIGAPPDGDTGDQDGADAESFYRLLEDQVVPLYYERDRSDVPKGWVRVMKEAIRSVSPVFTTRRMLKQYAERMYVPAAQSVRRVLR